MLTVRCSACKTKLWQYDKIGPGKVLRCHKSRIRKMYEAEEREGRIFCPCGKDVGIDKGKYYKMIAKAFTYRGTKRNRLFHIVSSDRSKSFFMLHDLNIV